MLFPKLRGKKTPAGLDTEGDHLGQSLPFPPSTTSSRVVPHCSLPTHRPFQKNHLPLGEAARALRVDPSGLRPIAWTRPHTRNRSHDIPRSGFTDPYRLFGPSWALAEIQPLLTLGQAQGAGGHMALDLGQYHLICPNGPSNSETLGPVDVHLVRMTVAAR
ncbi:hypothetical protein [Rhodospirillum sp. A1_3_36]|uniref:hypothetical protein n=1 Tax=Rhodospirillum sp. A1_3_36 TaxID=3391666 RepID=UPI0039A78532